jgi:lyso-ornithine lipid O-acyltransferase
MIFIRLLFRAVFAVLYTVAVVLHIWFCRFLLKKGQAAALRLRRLWARRLLYLCGVRVRTSGVLPTEACLLVANHRSAIDPILLLRDVLALPVSKAEVADWPVLGKGAQLAGGILYLRREDGGSRTSMLRAMADTIVRDGWSVLIFPEGTTSDLDGTLPFRPGSFQMAARLGIAVVPVAIIFEKKSAWWVGQESFAAHAKRKFGQHRIRVEVRYGPPLRHADGAVLCQQAEDWVRQEVAVF